MACNMGRQADLPTSVLQPLPRAVCRSSSSRFHNRENPKCEKPIDEGMKPKPYHVVMFAKF